MEERARERGGERGIGSEREREKGSIWPGSVWEVKDRNGGYISYRSESAMRCGVIISAKQTPRFYRDKLQNHLRS